jgi:hypothetical protein
MGYSVNFRLSTLAIYLFACSTAAHANDPFQGVGTSITTGSISFQQNMSSISNNPAAASHFMQNESGLVLNILPPIGAGYEVGQIDSLIDELDELIDILENDNLTAQDALDAKDRFDPFLKLASQDGLLKVSGHAGIPLFPIFYFNSEFGTFTLNAKINGSLRSTVIDDSIDIIGFNDSFIINTSAAVYVKSAGLTQFSAGYSRPVWKRNEGVLHAGATLNINRLSLSKNLISLAGLEDGEDIGDAIEDDYEKNEQSSTNLSLDLGALWVDTNYSMGLSINDINAPEYDYKTLVSDCSQEQGISLDNCLVAQEAIARGKITGQETFVANTQATFEASAWLGNENKWLVHTSIDLNDKNDPLGDVYQWASLSASTQFNNWVIPGLRIGYSQNLAGTELSYYSIGMTLFKRAQLDVRWSSDSVEVDGSNIPRSAFFSFSIQSQF